MLVRLRVLAVPVVEQHEGRYGRSLPPGLGGPWTDHATPRGSLAAAKVAVPFDFRALERHRQGLGVIAVVLCEVPPELSFAAEPQLTTGTLLYVTHRLIPSSGALAIIQQLWSEQESHMAWTRAD